jgi:hypothetical protein
MSILPCTFRNKVIKKEPGNYRFSFKKIAVTLKMIPDWKRNTQFDAIENFLFHQF